MEQRALGRTGLSVSALGFGCGSVGGLMVRGAPAEQTRAVARALDAGITYFDTAPGYGNGRSEENLGRALRELGAWERVVVGTKVRLSADDLADPTAAIRRSLEQSLRLLGRDAVDLIQLHNPIASTGTTSGAGIPLEMALGPVMEGLNQAVSAGLARHAGFTGLGDTEAVHAVVRSGHVVTAQSYFNAVNPSAGFAGVSGGEQDFGGLIDAASAAGLGVIAIRVLAAGAMTATPERAPNAGNPGGSLAAGATYERDLDRARMLTALASALGLESSVELALRFALAKPGVSTVLAGYSNLEQLDECIRWAERGPLPDGAVRHVLDAART